MQPYVRGGGGGGGDAIPNRQEEHKAHRAAPRRLPLLFPTLDIPSFYRRYFSFSPLPRSPYVRTAAAAVPSWILEPCRRPPDCGPSHDSPRKEERKHSFPSSLLLPRRRSLPCEVPKSFRNKKKAAGRPLTKLAKEYQGGRHNIKKNLPFLPTNKSPSPPLLYSSSLLLLPSL